MPTTLSSIETFPAAVNDRFSRLIERLWDRAVPPTQDEVPAIDAELHSVDVLGAGRLRFYSAAGEGPPVVLVHSIAPGSGAHEVAPLFDRLRGKRRVYALDLPGFGLSERAPLPDTTPEMFVKSIVRFLVDVVEPGSSGADVVALGLSSELVARAALEAPELVRSLVLLSPTGLAKHARKPSPAAKLLGIAPLARPIHALLTGRKMLARTLQKSLSVELPEGLLDQAYRAAHAKGAHRSLEALLRGTLEHPKALEEIYAKLEVPTLIVHDRAAHTNFRRLTELLRRNPRVRDVVIGPSRGLVTHEHPDVVAEAVLSQPPAEPSAGKHGGSAAA